MYCSVPGRGLRSFDKRALNTLIRLDFIQGDKEGGGVPKEVPGDVRSPFTDECLGHWGVAIPIYNPSVKRSVLFQ